MAGKQALIVPALKKHSATVIMAHGLGDRFGIIRAAEPPAPWMAD
jgi:hypothetical protein